ncbi:MAG: A/G-specific adenine glycosylase [Bacteroidota bacterium]|nr:A/G-specific adenine glycosylase [Bacteroidota bacterium]MDP4212190.1 A/G-specific adenine glycosylase [Bacteroidota bacterium]MDP4249060.1 A/G-specific adenine glycosylase [Bacteroidota bacterium]
MISLNFSKRLRQWNSAENVRTMPWKGEKDPYRIWLSEIILQQTRVEQGWAYYEKFISAYPTVQSLAKAKEKEIFKLWEGLGYYNRCRNLIATAKKITREYDGRFPASYNDVLELPGVGTYTASAIVSFAFGLPYAVVDGNVQRVLARYFGISADFYSAAGKKLYQSLAQSLLDKKDPGTFNQAIMDFGAVICKPRNPLCFTCIQAKNCQAFRQQWVDLLPIKAKPAVRKIRWFYYFIANTKDGKYWIRRRKEKDIWENLFEFILWETGKLMPQRQIEESMFVREHFGKSGFHILHFSDVLKQTLTHQTIYGRFIHISLNKQRKQLKNYQLVPAGELSRYPFPVLITNYLKKFNQEP